MEYDQPGQELDFFNCQLISILNSLVQVYHKVPTLVDKGGSLPVKLSQKYKNVCNSFIAWMSCFFKSIPLSLIHTGPPNFRHIHIDTIDVSVI